MLTPDGEDVKKREEDAKKTGKETYPMRACLEGYQGRSPRAVESRRPSYWAMVVRPSSSPKSRPFTGPLPIVDDMGMKQLPKRSGEYLFEIIMRRYETRATMMTSNRPLEDWGKLIGDIPSATAILDRFLHHAGIVTITGRS